MQKMACILVILPSTHSPTGILMQREDYILGQLFLAHVQSKKIKGLYRKGLWTDSKRKNHTLSIS